MTIAHQTSGNEMAIRPAASRSPVPAPGAGRCALVLAARRARGHLARAALAASEAQAALQQIRSAIDPREVAGGYAGLTAGEVIGGAVGGVAGAAVGGPPGAIVGAEVGAFTMGMLGLKLGMDAVHDYAETRPSAGHVRRSAPALTTTPDEGRVVNELGSRVRGRAGEIIGLTSGATVGLAFAGPAGGFVGAVVGETVGGRFRQDAARILAARDPLLLPRERATQWLDRFGKNTAGEAATVLVAGGIGALFGPSGFKVGNRLGRVVSKRIEWDRLGASTSEAQPDSQNPGPRQDAPAGSVTSAETYDKNMP